MILWINLLVNGLRVRFVPHGSGTVKKLIWAAIGDFPSLTVGVLFGVAMRFVPHGWRRGLVATRWSRLVGLRRGETNRGVVEKKKGRPQACPFLTTGRTSLVLLFAFLLLLQSLFFALGPFGGALDEFAAYEFEDA